MFHKIRRYLAAGFACMMMAEAVFGGAIPIHATEISGNDLKEVSMAENVANEVAIEEGLVESKLNYIYLDSKSVATPASEMIMVSYGNADTQIVDAKLAVTNYYTKAVREYSFTDTFENTALFQLDYSVADRGIYEVTGFWVTTADGISDCVSVKETGMDAIFFGVDEVFEETRSDVTALASEEDIDLSQIDMQIVSLGADATTANGSDKITRALVAGEQDIAGGARMQTEDTELTTEKEWVVMLDPGHDGSHAGANKNGLREEVLTLKIAQYCKEELSKYGHVKVYMTRESAACPLPGSSSVQDNLNRVARAASVGADIYVSIHLNSAGTGSAHGAEVFYPNKNYNAGVGSAGANLATQIQRQLTALGLKNNGISIRNSADKSLYPDGSLADYYAVIKHSKLAGFPGVIIEHAYVSNASDAAFLKSEENLKALGIADATGIVNYLDLNKREPADKGKVTAFVTRLYQKCLNREPDEGGLEYWVNSICEGDKTGVEAAYGFFFSQEMTEANLTDDEFVEVLYNVLLDRESDIGGKSDWVYKLENGASRYGVFIGFANSIEFDALCVGAGIDRGNAEYKEGRDRNLGLTTFICRLYTKALGREYDLDGLNEWCTRVSKKEWTITEVSTTGFFNSQEFVNKKLKDGDYVEVLYQTFFDREADKTGYEYWLKEMKGGKTREDVIKGFADSEEFSKLKASYGL